MDNDLIKRQRDFYQGLWVGTILLVLLLIAIWIIPIFSNEFTLKKKLFWTISVVLTIPLGWIFFYYQKKKDEGKIKQEKKIVKGYIESKNVVSGYYLKFLSLKHILFSAVFLLFGIYALIFEKKYWWVGLILIVVAVLLPVAIKGLWKLGGQRQKRRFY